MKHRNVMFVAIPAIGALLLIGTLVMQRDVEQAPRAKAPRYSDPDTPAPTRKTLPIAPLNPVVQPEEAKPKADEARIRTTFENYVSAVASGSRPFQDALLPVLRRDRTVALRMAEEHLANAEDGAQRDTAQRAIEALRR